jgi:VWFA-related protein
MPRHRCRPHAAGFAFALAIAAILAILALVPAVTPAAAERFAGESTNVVAIEVPVEVVKDGQPVRGLSAADFEVAEGRRKLKVTGFDVVDLATASTQPGTAALSTAARRRFLLLFDFAFSDPRSVAKARQAARDLVLKGLHPTDLVAVVTYSLAQGSQLALDFTSDRRQIDWAIENLGRPLDHGKAADPLRLVVTQSLAAGKPDLGTVAPSPELGGQGADTPGALGTQADRQNREDQQNRVVALSRSLADLAKTLGNVDGRKYVVYLSEGFDSSLLTGAVESRDQQEQQAQVDPVNPTSTLDPATNPWATDTEARHGNTRLLNRMEKTFEELRRADCVIQAVDIGGLRAGGGAGGPGGARPNGREALFSLARETGGELYENYNDLSGAMGQMLKRTSVTYVLTVQPEDLKLDGAYHRITVALKNPPRGTRVVAKPGFYAPKPFAQRNPLERMLDAADSIVGGVPGGTIATSVLAAAFRPASGTAAYVPVLIEVDGPGLLADQTGDVAPTEIYAYALDGTGAVRDFFSQNLGLDLAKVGPQVKKSGLKFFGHLDLPAGDYSLRVLVRNGKTGAYGLRVVPVQVPVFQAAGPVLLPPFFPEPPGKWLMTRETPRGAAAAGQDVPYPFMMREEPYIPASRPVLGSGQDARLSLVVYNLGEGEVSTAAKIFGADGREVQPAEVTVTDRERGGAARPDRLTASFKAPELAPGEYRLQVTLTAGGGAQTSSIPFVVAKPGQRG